MEDKKINTNVNNFRIDRINKLKEIYSDELSTRRNYNRTTSYSSKDYDDAAAVRTALNDAISDRSTIVETSRKLYDINPIYSSVINYLANMFMWRYKVIPHKVYTKSKAKLRKQIADDDFRLMYNLMLEVVDGLSVETKLPELLTILFTDGAVYLTTLCDDESLSVDTLLLPDKYCRKVASTQFGTAVIEFDFSYFQTLGLTQEQLKEYLQQFPKEFKTNYNKYLKDSANMRWQQLDPHFSTGVLLNEASIPTLFYLYGGILDYEQYQDNELERNENQLKYVVSHKMPIYQDKLIFDVGEVSAIHKSLKKVIDTGDKTRLITTYGDIGIHKLGDNETTENQVLSKAFKAIFNNAGFNSAIFTGESVEALKDALIRDKGMVWKYVQEFVNFYNIAINNWFDFKTYQANFEILPISSYTYTDDIEVYKNNATLGVDKLGYIIASGIKQKNVEDQLSLESFLNLNSIQPMQTSYTQSSTSTNSGDDSSDDDNTSENVDSNESVSTNTATNNSEDK